jgi:hypothetical protein
MKLLAGLLLTLSMYGAVDKDMQRAIAWERAKDRAAARQARLEKRHPSVTYNNNDNSANRSADDSSAGNQVKDPGPKNQFADKDKVKEKK